MAPADGTSAPPIGSFVAGAASRDLAKGRDREGIEKENAVAMRASAKAR